MGRRVSEFKIFRILWGKEKTRKNKQRKGIKLDKNLRE